METKGIMIVGVGGQGTLLASKILGKLFLSKGLDVKVSEVHGMSQRGGSVVTYVKFGDKVYSPIIDKGEADIILSFEILEAARWIEYLKEDGYVLTNSQEINPMPVINGVSVYPTNLEDKIRKLGINIKCIDALTLANKAGSSKAVNIVLLGNLSNSFDFTVDEWMKVIEDLVPPKYLELNKKAFLLGRSA